tara:strand:+ start:7466 stop:8980 length:1515 start_codon:yes stop_codon:yes gene_type:complete
MKIFTAAQIRKADQFTIQNEPISSVDLMERAATVLFENLLPLLKENQPVYTFCGIGNNGGDGLVFTRLLLEKGYAAKAVIVRFSDKTSDDFTVNFSRLEKMNPTAILELKSIEEFPEMEPEAIVVDGIFGSGLAREVEGFPGEVIDKINAHKGAVFAIDVPSGLFCEDNSKNKGSIVKADVTFTFQYPKLAFLFPENAPFVGDFKVLNIDLLPQYEQQEFSPYHLVTQPLVEATYRIRPKFSHKGTFGHALLLAGSKGKIGAAVLSAKAALRSGLGLLTVHTAEPGYTVIQTAVPEAMCTTDQTDCISSLPDVAPYKVLGVGPGIGVEDETANILKMAIQNSSAPMVLDADALNILAQNTTWLEFLPKGSVLTPHPGEFARFKGKMELGFHRMEAARAMSQRYGIYIVLKGAHTQICCPDGDVFFNSTGNPGMATGGSGDVLTGILTALLAQGYNPKEACVLGVFLHGRAGDLAAETVGEEALVAGEIVAHIPQAWQSIYPKKM